MDKKFKVGQTVVVDDTECVIKSVAITKKGKFYTVTRGDTTVEGVPEKHLSKVTGRSVDEALDNDLVAEEIVAPQTYENPTKTDEEVVVEPKGSEEPQE